MDDKHNEMGRRIRQFRESSGMTQREVAQIAGVNWNTISHAETGRYRPSARTLHGIARALNTSVAYLLGEEPDADSLAHRVAMLDEEDRLLVAAIVDILLG